MNIFILHKTMLPMKKVKGKGLDKKITFQLLFA